MFTDDLRGRRRGAEQIGTEGHRQYSYNGEPETSTEHTQASAWAKLLHVIKTALESAANLRARLLEREPVRAVAHDQPVITPGRMFARPLSRWMFSIDHPALGFAPLPLGP